MTETSLSQDPKAPLRGRTVLVTGAAGFIGFHLVRGLSGVCGPIVGVDSLSPYYDVQLKQDRLNILTSNLPGFQFKQLDIADRSGVEALFDAVRPDVVLHMAAQAGVRHSLTDPYAYLDSNLLGFLNIAEGCRKYPVSHFVYASSSSVYGANANTPFSVHQTVDHPISLYAATKKSNELIAHSYSHLYAIPTTGLRFFTVYGPWGRPDMAAFKFTRAILAGEPLPVFNRGNMRRDFTYIDDIVEGVIRVAARPATASERWSPSAPDPAIGAGPYRLFNIGNNRPEDLMQMISLLEQALGRKAKLQMLPMQPGDVPVTSADIDALEQWVGFRPSTPLAVGLGRFVDWYLQYHGIKETAAAD